MMKDDTVIPNDNNRSSSDEIDINVQTSLVASTNHILDLTKANNAGESFIYSPPFKTNFNLTGKKGSNQNFD